MICTANFYITQFKSTLVIVTTCRVRFISLALPFRMSYCFFLNHWSGRSLLLILIYFGALKLGPLTTVSNFISLESIFHRMPLQWGGNVTRIDVPIVIMLPLYWHLEWRILVLLSVDYDSCDCPSILLYYKVALFTRLGYIVFQMKIYIVLNFFLSDLSSQLRF